MSTVRSRSSRYGTALAAVLGTLLLTGCALIQPPPVPSTPRLGRPGSGDATCGAEISRAHVALADAGAAGGDAAAAAAANAAYAADMAEYHNCLALSTAP